MSKMIERITSVSEGVQTKVTSKNHTLIIDEPASMGGKDEGPNPLATLLGALSGCETVVAGMVAKEMNFDLQGIDFDISGELDPRGMMGDENVRPYFNKITINAKVKTTESDDRIQELKEKTDSRCPVFTTLKAADIEMIANWVKE
ncbi:OsmC family protein [Metabacillus sp. 84]|uniref:OsmC family protein n=1 Tax=unclassified Metabacillus TaxID=2675274 RepID=UPI003CF37EAA